MLVSKAIDPARTGISKSLMTNPCERKGFYSETVRDEAGRRLSFPMPERVLFGSAVDEATSFIVYKLGEEGVLAYEPGMADQFAYEAAAVGIDRVRRESGWALLDPEARKVFEVQVRNAVDLYVRTPDGLARLAWAANEDNGLWTQGMDGRSLRWEDVIGTPDFVTPRRVIDVKTWSRNDGARKVWESPEMGTYALLFTSEMGYLPDTVVYHAYIRVSKPYWTWIEADASRDLVAFGRQSASHWRALLAAGNPDLAAASTRYCGDCPFRNAIPTVDFDGCPVGRLVPSEEAAA